MSGDLVLVWKDPSRTEERVRLDGDVVLGHGVLVFVPRPEDPNRRTTRVVPLGNLWEYRLSR